MHIYSGVENCKWLQALTLMLSKEGQLKYDWLKTETITRCLFNKFAISNII